MIRPLLYRSVHIVRFARAVLPICSRSAGSGNNRKRIGNATVAEIGRLASLAPRWRDFSRRGSGYAPAVDRGSAGLICGRANRGGRCFRVRAQKAAPPRRMPQRASGSLTGVTVADRGRGLLDRGELQMQSMTVRSAESDLEHDDPDVGRSVCAVDLIRAFPRLIDSLE